MISTSSCFFLFSRQLEAIGLLTSNKAGKVICEILTGGESHGWGEGGEGEGAQVNQALIRPFGHIWVPSLPPSLPQPPRREVCPGAAGEGQPHDGVREARLGPGHHAAAPGVPHPPHLLKRERATWLRCVFYLLVCLVVYLFVLGFAIFFVFLFSCLFMFLFLRFVSFVEVSNDNRLFAGPFET